MNTYAEGSDTSHVQITVIREVKQNPLDDDREKITYQPKGTGRSRVTKPSYVLWHHKPSYKLENFDWIKNLELLTRFGNSTITRPHPNYLRIR